MITAGVCSGAAAATSFADNFNRSNENLEASANWTRLSGTAGTLQVVSNQLKMAVNAAAEYQANFVAPVNHAVQVTYQSAGSSGTHFMRANYVNATNNASLYFASGSLMLVETVGGVDTTLMNAIGGLSVGDVIKLEMLASTYRVSVNGTVYGTYTRTIFGQRAGFACGSGFNFNQILDDFSIA